jgi:Immunity protein 26
MPYGAWQRITSTAGGFTKPPSKSLAESYILTLDIDAMSRAKHKLGTFLRILLADGSFAYGRTLEAPHIAFYSYRTTEPSADLDEIERQPILFKQAVRSLGQEKWEAIGIRELEGDVAKPAVSYMQDLLDFKKCVIFDTAGERREATPEECVGIEQAAVWEANGIEERLLDTFMGRPNEEEIRSRVRLQ